MKLSKSYSFFKRTVFFFQASLVLALGLFSGCNDRGEKISRAPVDANSYGKTQEDIQTNLLQKYVDQDKYIFYKDWRKSPEDLKALQSVLSAMAKADTAQMTVDGKKAFYLNAYNAMTIELILNHYDEALGGTGSPYPAEKSIRNIGNLDAKVWDFYKWTIAGQAVSLNDVENKILRPMGDARIHFAIVCASKGCPPILNEALSEKNLNLQLDRLAEEFVNSGRNTTIDAGKNEIKTSHILEWFSQDFIATYGSVKAFFSKFSKTSNAAQIQTMNIKYNIYDWLLNESNQQFKANEIKEEPKSTPPDESVGSGTEEDEPIGSGTESDEDDEDPVGSGTESDEDDEDPVGSGTESEDDEDEPVGSGAEN